MKKKVLIISAVFPPEPVTSATLNYDLTKVLSVDFDVVVINPKPSRPMGFDFHNIPPINTHNFKQIVTETYVHPKSTFRGRLKESMSFGKACVKYITEHHNDIDFVYNDGWQLFGLYMVAKICVKYDIPYVVPIQDIYPESLLTKLPDKFGLHCLIKKLLGWMDRYYIKHAATVRTISEGMADYLSKTRKVSRDKFLVIANWQNDNEFDEWETPYRKNGKTVFMFVGNNNKQAGVELMIRSYHKAKLQNAEFWIMGGGNEKSNCQKLAKELGHNDILFSDVPVGAVARVQKEADVMVLALMKGTGTQGVPSKLTAYMMSGKPVIASLEDEADAAKMIIKAKSGIVSPADDEISMANSFEMMAAKSNEELQNMGKNSRLYAEEFLSRKQNLSKLRDKIKKIIYYGRKEDVRI